jgi:hypothetical protein
LHFQFKYLFCVWFGITLKEKEIEDQDRIIIEAAETTWVSGGQVEPSPSSSSSSAGMNRWLTLISQ